MSRLLELDMASMAGATGHAACHRLAAVLTDFDPNLWVNGGVPVPNIDPEWAVQQLADYVCVRRVTSGEVLFIKAHELGLHQFGAQDYFTLEPWQRTAYALFAAATLTSYSILAQAQLEAREREERLRAAALAAKPQDPTPDLPAASPVGGQEATPAVPPVERVANTAAEGEGAAVPQPSAAVLIVEGPQTAAAMQEAMPHATVVDASAVPQPSAADGFDDITVRTIEGDLVPMGDDTEAVPPANVGDADTVERLLADAARDGVAVVEVTDAGAEVTMTLVDAEKVFEQPAASTRSRKR